MNGTCVIVSSPTGSSGVDLEVYISLVTSLTRDEATAEPSCSNENEALPSCCVLGSPAEVAMDVGAGSWSDGISLDGRIVDSMSCT